MPVYLKNVVTLRLDVDQCVGCGLCGIVCPHGVFVVEDGAARITQRDACMECGACARNCPAGAIDVRPGVGCATGVLFGRVARGEDCCGAGKDCCG